MDKNAIIKALRDYAQATSNEVANTVAGPIDLINTGLGRIGLGSEEPVGGSAWMRRQGLTAPVPEGIAQTLGETTGLVLPMAGAIKAKEIATSLRNMGENMAKPKSGGMGGGQRGAIVWHGSPHKFDKFDASKIGTGEGAQAYGHGLYVAESPDVATTYSNMRATPNMEFHTASGRKLTGLEKAIADDITANGVQIAGINAKANGPEWLDAFKRIKDETITRGNLYKIDLPDEHVARMLDWDRPLSEQQVDVLAALQKSRSSTVRKFLETADTPGVYSGELPTGESLVRHLSMQSSGRQIDPKASLTLQKAGIPGIRYLDGGSRGAGAGTSNFVVFPGNENILNILERNGAPIPPQNLVKALRNGN